MQSSAIPRNSDDLMHCVIIHKSNLLKLTWWMTWLYNYKENKKKSEKDESGRTILLVSIGLHGSYYTTSGAQTICITCVVFSLCCHCRLQNVLSVSYSKSGGNHISLVVRSDNWWRKSWQWYLMFPFMKFSIHNPGCVSTGGCVIHMVT